MTPLRPPFNRCDVYLKRCRARPDDLRILAIGDSWLSLPGGLWRGNDIVEFLNERSWVESHGARPMHVLSFAHPGKELKHMARDIDLHQGLAFLQDAGDLRRIKYRFDAVIVTGGGNDILPFPDRWIGPGADGNGEVLEGPLAAALNDIRASWHDVIKLVAPWRCPVVAHGYGAVTPTRKSGDIIIPGLGIGPWVGGYLLDELGLTVARGKELIGIVIDRLNETMKTIPGLSWFDARDTVAAIPPKDWHDEIHFFEPGWERLSVRWLEAIATFAGAAPAVATSAVAKSAVAKRAGKRAAVDLTPQFKALKPFVKAAVAEAIARADAKDAGKAAPKRAVAKKAAAKRTAATKPKPRR
ncbi:MAG TPA: hypothetical protein VJ724_14370 [Tahibacter sp.]|nr:hypothetical protein [Tahibacter sp.]